ncbi:hypothetical protein CB0940_05577 [Cercospora beticola]|uniref:Uncharacterized protein n=1 Tax=Cercospora beticola TaxID=122368 RepID=A0A2G5HXJ4_CERBT|nr:hypothetical protein CB0940_05577 [Cercospora beticola]PIA97265.1 hypothetical protein CB0940_05577 [Cercospora beticola]WPA98140.1 hypothetical protein RHO25_002751 [Cercospora beticola]CAK1359355.1 unnamed protein product [Cercospora beticola]
MPTQAWFEPKIAPTAHALDIGDGCHPDEAKALGDYLNGNTNPEEAAKRFTAPVLADANPPKRLYRIWALLSEALVELTEEERHMTFDLMSAIQALPPSSGVDWAELTGFGAMWYDLYKSHLHGPHRWERQYEVLSEEEKREFRQDYNTVGTAEAEMFVRGFPTVGEYSGFKVLNLLCSPLPRALNIFVSHMHPWLRIAGPQLKAKVDWSQTEKPAECWERRIDGKTTAFDWETWKEELLKLSKDGSGLSEEGRKVAAECYELM